ncbi:MAG: right-handed parallel beta-helix repeat-containing protein [Kofleriaceae bacterium]
MTRRATPARAALLALATCVASCLYADNPYYCEGLPNNFCQPAAPGACTSSAQCGGATPVCDVEDTGVCVPCTTADDAACGDATPVCGDDHTCRGCRAHAECATAACLPEGRCGNAAEVAYVTEGASDAGLCTQAVPCATVARALTTGRPFLKLAGTLTESLTIEGGRQVTLLAAPDARLTGGGGGALITVRDTGTSLAIFDLALTDAPNNTAGYGVIVPAGSGAPSVTLSRVTISNCPAGGISLGAGALTLSRSTLSNNRGGGLAISGVDTTFVVHNNMIVYNGRALGAQPSSVGGVAISSNTAGSSFERNTVAFNESDGLTFRGGVSCNAPRVAAAGNLLFHNVEPDGTGSTRSEASTQRNTQSACAFGDSAAIASDLTNLGFASPLIAPLDFHLTSSSPPAVRDAGGACTGVDFDGEPRPYGAGCDLGADELQPSTGSTSISTLRAPR